MTVKTVTVVARPSSASTFAAARSMSVAAVGRQGPSGPMGPTGPAVDPATVAEMLTGTNTTKAVTPGRLRGLAMSVDVRWFGAVADGVTDCLAAFNSAVAYALSSGLRSVTVPGGGTYKISNTWVIRASNIEVVVEAGATISLTVASTLGGAVAIAEGAAFGGSDAAMLENVVLRGGGWIVAAGDAENAVGIVRARNVTVEGLNISAGRYGITGQVKVEDSHIVRNTIWSAHAAAIDISDVGTVTMLNNRIEGNVVLSSTVSGALAGEGIRATCFDGLIVRDNTVIYSQGRGIRIYGTNTVRSKRLVIGGNRVVSTGSLVIDLQYIDHVVGPAAVQGEGGAANLAKLDTTDLGLSIINAAALSSFTLDTLTGPSRLKLVCAGQVAATGALSVISPPSGHDWEVQIGAGNHNRICANAVALNLRGSAVSGSSEAFGTGCTLLPTSSLAVNGGRKVTAVAYAATITPDFWTQSTISTTLAGNLTIANAPVSNVARVPGQRITFVLTQDATGGRTVTWGSNYRPGAWQMPPAPDAVGTITYESDGTNWVAVGQTGSGRPVPGALRGNLTGQFVPVCPGASTTTTYGNGVANFQAFDTDSTITVANIVCEVTGAGSAGAVLRPMLYADDGTGTRPGARIVDAGTIDATTTGVKTSGAIAATLSPARYWVAVVIQGAPTTTPTLRVNNGAATPIPLPSAASLVGMFPAASGVTGAAPDPAPALTAGPSSTAPRVYLKLA